MCPSFFEPFHPVTRGSFDCREFRSALSLIPLLLCIGFATVVTTGCGGPPGSEQPTERPTGTPLSEERSPRDTASDQAQGTGVPGAPPSAPSPAGWSGPKKPFVLGDLLQPFDPPSWEDLQKVQWIDQPVLDSLELLRERQAQETPLATVAEALALRNSSPEANAKILSALGRLPASPDEADWDATIFRHTGADVKSTNPLMIDSTIEFDVSGLTSFGLFSFDWNFRPFAAKDAVVSWQTSADRMMDKVIMRRDLTWSDGRPITAHDVVFSFKVIMSDQVPIPAMRSGTDQLRWVEAYDDYTLVFFHKQPLATNVWNLNFAVIPRHIYEKSIYEDPTLQDSEYHRKYEEQPISGGPYKIVRRVRGSEIVLQRREDYYMFQGKQVREKPFFREIRFRILPDPSGSLMALIRGDIDEMILTPEQWMTQTDSADFYRLNTKVYATEWTYFYFCWNTRTPFFNDRRVRLAMSYAFNYSEMFDKLLYGLAEPCNGIFHPSSSWAPTPPLPFFRQDLDKAEELLDEAGWVDSDGDGIRDKMIDGRRVRFEFSLLTVNLPLRIAIANLMRESLERIGVICHVRPLEFTVLQERTRTGDFHAFHGGWGTGADPDTAENIWKTGEMRNFGRYSNPEVDRLFELGKKEFDPARRAEIYRQIHRMLYEDQPYTWLYFRPAMYAFNKKLRGYTFSPRGPYHFGPGFGSIYKVRFLP
jgi:peptide/nickel transport system substrate-binding protein